MIRMHKVGHLMHDHIFKNPYWHVKKPVRYSNSPLVGCAASVILFLISDKLDRINFELAMEIFSIEIIKPFLKMIIFIDMSLELLFLHFLFHFLYELSFLFVGHSKREIHYKSLSDHLCLNGLFSVRASYDI